MADEIVFLDKTIEQQALSQSFSGEGAAHKLIKQIEEQAREKASILSADTPQGRKEIISISAQVSKAKVSLDNFGKALVENVKKQVKIVDNERKFIRDNLEILQKEIRQPVTDYENAEIERVKNATDLIQYIKNLSARNATELNIASSSLEENLQILNEIDVSEEALQEFSKEAEYEKNSSILFLTGRIEAAKVYEAEQLELAQLREFQVEQEAKNREEAIRREAEEKYRLEAQAVIERAEQEKQIAIRNAEREAQEKIEAERKRIADEEAKRLEEEAVQKAHQARIEAEELKRKADIEHRAFIHKTAKEAFISEGFNDDDAIKIVNIIRAKKIPNVMINY